MLQLLLTCQSPPGIQPEQTETHQNPPTPSNSHSALTHGTTPGKDCHVPLLPPHSPPDFNLSQPLRIFFIFFLKPWSLRFPRSCWKFPFQLKFFILKIENFEIKPGTERASFLVALQISQICTKISAISSPSLFSPHSPPTGDPSCHQIQQLTPVVTRWHYWKGPGDNNSQKNTFLFHTEYSKGWVVQKRHPEFSFSFIPGTGRHGP